MVAVLALLGTLASAPIFAASDCPLPQGMQASISLAKQALGAREAGVTKRDLLTYAPPVSDVQMPEVFKAIVDEVYDFPPLRPEVYAAYRFEHCFVSQQHAARLASLKFADVHPLLKQCEQIEPEGARPPCAMRALHKVTGIPE
ncbi:MAG: hypothetical protein LBJ37_05650 [Paucimonas sp.]|jgi:hypothetical protein|nr:hypothetical protein [Paucimonas sp.]